MSTICERADVATGAAAVQSTLHATPTRDGHNLGDYLPLLNLRELTCYRSENFSTAGLAAEMQERGKLVLTFSLGHHATAILAKTTPDDLPWMKRHKLWHTYGLSSGRDGFREVLLSTIPLPDRQLVRGVTGCRRGRVLGYSDKSRATVRKTCLALLNIGWIQGGLTIGKLPSARAYQLHAFQKKVQRIMKRTGLPHFATWEGHLPHIHALIGPTATPVNSSELERRIAKAYVKCFKLAAPPTLTLWKPGNAVAAAHYKSKTYYPNNDPVKGHGATDWLSWPPYFSHGVPREAVRRAIDELPPMSDEAKKHGMARALQRKEARRSIS